MTLFIDLAILAALVCAVLYGFVLSQRVARLMRILEDLQPAIAAFSQAVDKSESSATGLRSAAIKLAEEVGQAKGAQSAPRRASVPARRAPDTEKSDMVRGFFDTLHARGNA